MPLGSIAAIEDRHLSNQIFQMCGEQSTDSPSSLTSDKVGATVLTYHKYVQCLVHVCYTMHNLIYFVQYTVQEECRFMLSKT